ncbi:signal recognition particle-docking protein FtsY [Kallotenue papyrolyticum]|uniref:signal recognition particle-docking protein FtsY n=1 Tax=Kallotenue papyrolyticum TaxID=1325125 RepID=UPI0004786398|nr:signal recognition particle-docking protein FtsY [Kallotenue papyrolyticum]
MFRRWLGGEERKPEQEPETPPSPTESAAAAPDAAREVQPLTAQQEGERRRGGLLRRWFAGEEREEQEIRQEVQKTSAAVQKTRNVGMFGRIAELLRGDDPVTPELWEELEELLIAADVGVETTLAVLERVQRKVERNNVRRASDARALLKQELVRLLDVDVPQYSERSTKPYVILVVGVNGSGKTTLIAKMANRYKQMGKSVILAAADTFRAAAVEQLQTWADRIGVPVIAQGQGADPGAVAYDAVQATYARQADILIIDTAGRLQSKYNLMQELAKIKNVVRKRVQWAPHEVLLVIDATTGQNGISQAKAFMEASEVTHLALTKLDSSAKGGVAFAMVQEIERPIKYIGTGEQLDDLALFDAQAFVDALFADAAEG